MATTSTTGPGEYDRDLEVDERLHAEDLTEDPRLDAEALCLCAVLWSTPAAARVVLEHLVVEDFDRPAHRDLVAIITEQLQHNQPHDPASIAAVLTRQGTGHHGHLVAKALADATAAGAAPESAGHHAVHVVSASYRRGFLAADAGLAQAAAELAEDDLFPHLVAVGRAQRAATERLQAITAALDTSHTL